MSEQTEIKIRQILEKFIGKNAATINRDEDFWQQFPRSRYESKESKEFSNEISNAFNTTLTEDQWQDAVSISALAEILLSGKIGKDKKKKNLDMEIKASMRGIKNSCISLLPLIVLLVLIRKKELAIICFFVLLLAVGINYMIVMSSKKKIEKLQ